MRQNSRMRRLVCVLLAALASVAAALHADDGAPLTYAQTQERANLLRAAGRAIFLDAALSASGKQSCASCHDPAHRYNPPNARDVQIGGPTLRDQGFRAPPTLTYLDRVPPYDNHFYDSEDEADNSIDNGPTGGLTWDGRVDTGAAQAAIPLTSPFEMANTKADIARIARKASWGTLLRNALGKDTLNDDEHAFAAIARALGAFEEDVDEFAPYTSKYDAYLTGRAQLSAQERRGLALFNDENKGNCAQCHLSRRGLDGTPPAFSDYGLIALAVPRNANIARNRDPKFFDLGACGPERHDKAGQAEYCGLFRTPTLRNVVLRSRFFHNGKFHDLREVVEFYVTRDITPERWYTKDANGRTIAYDDLPAQYHANINRDPPFDGQHPGATPRLSESEIDDVVAFMRTLTDGYLKDNPYRAEQARGR
jgi:cytochrome c peroxidase